MRHWTHLVPFALGIVAFSTADDDDLIGFVTLPKHRILKWNVSYYDRDAVAPGYWFVAPYGSSGGEPSSNRWTPCQVGAHIFDQDGELVWAGSCEFEDRNVFDFHVVDGTDGAPNLAIGLPTGWDASDKPYILIYNNEMKETHRLEDTDGNLDLHEVNVYEPTKVLSMVDHPERVNMTNFGQPDRWVSIHGKEVVEFDLASKLPVWRWNAQEHISLDESYIWDAADEMPDPDYLHPNSVDKNKNGDYMLSARHTNAIYLISALDGHIIWRLGGKQSDFDMDFKFSGQHHARFMSVNDTHMTLSLFNNAANHLTIDEPSSSGMRIELDLRAMKATCLNQYHHPDPVTSRQRGNFQTLTNSNVLVSWSQNGFMSEFTHEGKLVMDASFASERFSTYRAYKVSLVKSTFLPPNSGGIQPWRQWLSIIDQLLGYWRFYARNASGHATEIGTVSKHGFETAYAAKGHLDWISVEALSIDYEVLGTSPVVRSAPPDYWPEGIDMPAPDDPAAMGPDSAKYTQTVFSPIALLVIFTAGVLVGVACYASITLFSSVRRLFQSRSPPTYSVLEHSEEPEAEVMASQQAK